MSFSYLLLKQCIMDEKKISKDFGLIFNAKEAEKRCKNYVKMFCEFSNCI